MPGNHIRAPNHWGWAGRGGGRAAAVNERFALRLPLSSSLILKNGNISKGLLGTVSKCLDQKHN